MTDMWQVPKSWIGKRCYIIGGGPSAIEASAYNLTKTGHVIAINDAFLLYPYADVLYFGDVEWCDDNIEDISKTFRGKEIITRVFVKPEWRSQIYKGIGFRRLGRDMSIGLSRSYYALSGWCSGSNAINLAYLYGATEIILIGFDMKGENWHTRHKRSKKPNCYNVDFIPYIIRMAAELNCECKVINTCMDSALNCFEKKPLAEVLADE